MRILYVIAMYGAEYLGNLIHQELGIEFQKRGHTLQVFALKAEKKLSGKPADSVEEGIAVHRAVGAGTGGIDAMNALVKPVFHYNRFGAGVWQLARYLSRSERFDLFIAEGAYPFGAITALAGRANRKKQAPILITAAGGDFIASHSTGYGYGRYRTARWLMGYAFSHAAAVRVTTPLVRARVIEMGARPEQIALIPRNIASDCFPPREKSLEEFREESRQALCARYQLDNARVIAAVGRLLPIKGFDSLVRALPRVIESAGDTRLILIGPDRVDPRLGDYATFLKKLAAEQGIGEKVIFTGAVPHREMRDYLAGVDVLAVPSVVEGMNKAAVEAAAVGTPSVVTRTAGVADLMQEAQIGEIVEESSPDALAGGLGSLLRDEIRRKAMIDGGLKFAEGFSSEVVGAQLIDLCERIVR